MSNILDITDQNGVNDMNHITTDQLKEAMITLYSLKTEEALAAYQLAFEELEKRLGEEKFDSFCDAYKL